MVRFGQALEVLGHLPKNRDLQEQAIDVRLSLFVTHNVLGELEKALGTLREAESLAESLQDPQRFGHVLGRMAVYFNMIDQPQEAIEIAHQVLSVAESSRDVGLQILVRREVSLSHRELGDYHHAIILLTENINTLSGDLQYETFGNSCTPAVNSRHMLIQCHNALGQFTESKRLQAEAVETAETMNHVVSLVFAYGPASSVYVMQGDIQRAIPLLERSVALCQTHHITLAYPPTLIFLSLAYVLAQREVEARQLLDEMISRRMRLRRIGRPAFIEALFLMGRVDDALTNATEALDKYPPEQGRGFRAEILRLLGDIYASSNLANVETAKTHYQQALTLATELGMRPLQAHCHRGLGTLYSRTGQPEQARAELTTAIEMYRDMDMTF